MKREGKTLFLKIIAFILLVLSIIFIIAGILFYNILFPQTTSEEDNRPNPFKDNAGSIRKESIPEDTTTQKDEPINEEQIGYVLYELNADELHTPLFSTEIPAIKINVDGQIFMARVVNNEIVIEEGEETGEDIKLITTKTTIIEATKSEDALRTIRDSIESGESRVEIVSDKKELLLKGYVSLYREITSEEVQYSPPERAFIAYPVLIGVIFLALSFIIYVKISKRKRA